MVICFTYKLIAAKRKDNSTVTFLIHFNFNAIADLLLAFTIIFFFKFLHWRFFLDIIMECQWMKIAFGPLLNSTIAASVIGCTYTVINRYFAICKPLIFKEKWTNTISLLLCFFQFFVPLLLFYYNFWFNAKIIYVASDDFYAFSIPFNGVRLGNNCILFVIVSISIYITIYQNIIIFKRFSQIVNNLSDKEKKKKHLMMFYMVATTTCLVILYFEQIARLIFGILKYEYGTYFTSFLLYWILPTLPIMQPISTLIMSKQIRNYFLSFYLKPFLPKNFRLQESTTVVKPNKTTLKNV